MSSTNSLLIFERIHLSSDNSFERILKKQTESAKSLLIFGRIHLSSEKNEERIERKKQAVPENEERIDIFDLFGN